MVGNVLGTAPVTASIESQPPLAKMEKDGEKHSPDATYDNREPTKDVATTDANVNTEQVGVYTIFHFRF